MWDWPDSQLPRIPFIRRNPVLMSGNASSRHLFAPVSSSPATLSLIHFNDDFLGQSLMNPYWIKTDAFRLAIIPRPRGQDWLLDDIRFLHRAGVDVVVSALTASENEELGLVDESQCCQSSGVEFLSFPIEDRSVPSSFSEFNGLVRRVAEYLRSGKAVGVSLPGRNWSFVNDCCHGANSEWNFSRIRLPCS